MVDYYSESMTSQSECGLHTVLKAANEEFSVSEYICPIHVGLLCIVYANPCRHPRCGLLDCGRVSTMTLAKVRLYIRSVVDASLPSKDMSATPLSKYTPWCQ